MAAHLALSHLRQGLSGKTMGIVNEIDWEADAMLVATTLALDIPVPPG
ncbi:MAG: hypothetical protein R2838_21695 [Caldilineaceae bacterium]